MFQLKKKPTGEIIKFGTITLDKEGLVFNDFKVKISAGRCDLFIIDEIIAMLEIEKKNRLTCYLPGHDTMGYMKV